MVELCVVLGFATLCWSQATLVLRRRGCLTSPNKSRVAVRACLEGRGAAQVAARARRRRAMGPSTAPMESRSNFGATPRPRARMSSCRAAWEGRVGPVCRGVVAIGGRPSKGWRLQRAARARASGVAMVGGGWRTRPLGGFRARAAILYAGHSLGSRICMVPYEFICFLH